MSSCRLTLCGKLWKLLPLQLSSGFPPLCWLLLLLVARAVTVLNELSAPCCGATVFNVHSPQIRFADRAQRHSARCPSTSLSLIRIAALCKAKHRQQQQQQQQQYQPTGCLRSYSLSNGPECACSMSAQQPTLSLPLPTLFYTPHK